jgi:hypothetical protein
VADVLTGITATRAIERIWRAVVLCDRRAFVANAAEAEEPDAFEARCDDPRYLLGVRACRDGEPARGKMVEKILSVAVRFRRVRVDRFLAAGADDMNQQC